MNKIIKMSITASLVATSIQAVETDMTISTASRVTQSIQDVTSNKTVITANELEAKHITTVNEALSQVAGITIAQNGGLGQTTSFFLRGFDSESTLVLINGISYNDPTTTGGQAQLEHLMVSDIEKIEIIKGAQSGIYGANTTAGVINIITKESSQELQTKANIEYGSFNTRKTKLSVGQKLDKFDYYLGFNYIKSDGFSAVANKDQDLDSLEDDGYENRSFNTKLSYSFSEQDVVNIIYNNINAKYDYDDFGAQSTVNNSKQKSKVLGLDFTHNFSKDIYTKLFFTKTNFFREYIEPNSMWQTYRKSEGISKSFGIDNKLSYGEKSFVLFGAIKNKSEDTNANKTLESKGFYLTNSNKFDNFVLTETIRQDNHDNFDNKTTGKVGIKYKVIKNLNLFSNYGIGYRTPSIDELYGLGYGNTTLKPETTKSFDIGFNYKSFELTYFDNKIDNEIIYDGSTFSFSNSNQKSKIKGLELKYSTSLNMDTLINMDYTWFKAEDEDGFQLAKRPKQIANINIDYYGFSRTHINLNTQYIGDRVEYNWNTHDIKAQTGKYVVSNINVNYTLNNQTKLYTKIDNITNKKYQIVDGYATSPRAYYMGVEYKF
jgi:vitamin B12 transporter